MVIVPKTVFSELTAIDLAGTTNVLEIQSHREVVGFFVPSRIMKHWQQAHDWLRTGNIEKAMWHLNEALKEGGG